MNENPLNQGAFTANSAELGEISGEMIAARARELALIARRPVIESDYEQARRELTGVPELEPRQALQEAIPESERWNPVAGSAGHQAQEAASEEEDADGQSESAQLFEEGVHEAEHDQMLQAARANQTKDLRDR